MKIQFGFDKILIGIIITWRTQVNELFIGFFGFYLSILFKQKT